MKERNKSERSDIDGYMCIGASFDEIFGSKEVAIKRGSVGNSVVGADPLDQKDVLLSQSAGCA